VLINAGFARIVGQGIRSVDELQQGDAADAKYRNLPSVLQHGQTKHVAVVGGEAIEIADHHADSTDVNRRTARGGGDCRRVGCVHGGTIWPVGAAAQLSKAPFVVSLKRRSPERAEFLRGDSG
jgi:hypothetical protein